MNRNLNCILVLILFLSLLVTGSAFATPTAPAGASKITHSRADGSEDLPMTKGAMLGSSSFAPPPQPPGDTVGVTEYDYQKNGSMGRQIVYTPNLNGAPYVHFVWMKMPGSGGFRHINYNAYKISTSTWEHSRGLTGGKEISGNRGGYTTIDVTSTGAAVGAWHEGPSELLYHTRSGVDAVPPTGVFTAAVFAPGPIAPNYNCQGVVSGTNEGDTYIWPVVEYQTMSNGDQVTHLVSAEAPPTTLPDEAVQSIIYYRYVNGVFDKCSNNDSLGYFIDSSQTINAVVRSDPNPTRDNVAIVYIQQIDFGSSNPCPDFTWAQGDIVYIESTDGGANWGSPVNVTDYSQGGALQADEIEFMAVNELSALYDSSGVLHIVWTTSDHAEDNPCQPLFRCSMWHWSDDQPPAQNISQVLDATNITGFCSAGIGVNMAAISKVNVSECYAGGDALLYVTFTQFGLHNDGTNEEDCSANGFANGDVMITASSDGGVTWGPDGTLPDWDTTSTTGTGTPVKKGTVVDLTNTFTRGCVSGDCHSETFPSTAKYSTDVVHIFYEDDNDAGAAVVSTPEGDVTTNALMYTTYDCFTPEPIFDYTTGADSYDVVVAPSDSSGCTIDATTTFGLRLTNNGNVPIDFTLTPDQTWISPSPSSGTITAGINATQIIPVTVGPVAAEGNYSGNINVDISSDYGSANFDVSVRLRARCQYYPDQYSDPLLSTSCWSVAVWNVARAGLALQSVLGNMYWFDDSLDLMFDEGIVITYADDLSKTYFSFFDGSDDMVYFEAASDLTLESHANYDYARGEFITPDKVVHGTAEYYVPTHPDTCVLIERITFTNDADTTIRIDIGEGIDWDIPDADEGSDNRSGANVAGQYVYQYGPATDPEQDYYGGAAFSHDIAGAVVLENDTWVYPNSGYVPSEIGQLLDTLTGFTASNPDSVEDLNSFYAVCQGVELDSAESRSICKVKTSSLSGKVDFDQLIAKGRHWAITNYVYCEPGDADGSGAIDIDDIVYLIAYAFTGGPPPKAGLCCGDADGSGSIDIDDIVYLIAYAFTGGPAPVKVCTC